MFSTSAQIVHTIAAPGSEFHILKQINLQGVFARIYTIDGQHTVEGKVRGLLNSFRDNTKANDIFREQRINDIGKETKSTSSLTWEDHALANNIREQDFLRKKIEALEKNIKKMEKEFPALIAQPKSKPKKKVPEKKHLPKKRASVRKRGRRSALADIPEEKDDEPNEVKQEDDDDEDGASDDKEEEYVGALRFQRVTLQGGISEIHKQIDDLHSRAQSGDYTDDERRVASKKIARAPDQTDVNIGKLRKIYVTLLQNLCSKTPEDLIDDLESMIFQSLEKDKLDSETISTRLHLVEEAHKKMNWVFESATNSEQPNLHIHRQQSNGKKFVDVLARLVHSEDAMEIPKTNRQPPETYFSRVVEVLNQRQNFRTRTKEEVPQKKRKPVVTEIADDDDEEEDEEERNENPKKAPPKKKTKNGVFVVTESCKYGRMCAQEKSGRCPLTHKNGFWRRCRTEMCSSCPDVHKWELQDPTLCAPKSKIDTHQSDSEVLLQKLVHLVSSNQQGQGMLPHSRQGLLTPPSLTVPGNACRGALPNQHCYGPTCSFVHPKTHTDVTKGACNKSYACTDMWTRRGCKFNHNYPPFPN